MAKQIQILKPKTGGFAINKKELFDILDKVSNKNIAIISINGNKRTGKSFLLNYFLRYLRSKDPESGEWVYGSGESRLNGFEWRGGAERTKFGIWLWSEPFIVKANDGSEVALLLLDTQYNFDEKTPECGIIFSLSALLSSTLILNMKNDVSEDKLQFVEFFTYFAESFSGETNLTGQLFQRLVFLVRDWENDVSYVYGCHDNDGPKSNNFKKDFIDPNGSQCNEAKHTRQQIQSYFNNVDSFLMPHPRPKFMKSGKPGQEFFDYVKLFVPLILSGTRIEAKKIGGQTVTGNSLKAYFSKWADNIETKKFPEWITLAIDTSDVNHMLAFKHAMTLYETKLRECLELKQTDLVFFDSHMIAKEESIQYFLNEPKGKINEQKKNEMLDDLKIKINQIFVIFRSNNCARIETENSEKILNKALEEQRLLQNKLNEQQVETDRKFAKYHISCKKYHISC